MVLSLKRFTPHGLEKDYRVEYSADVGAHVLMDKSGGVKRILSRSDSGGCDDWMVELETRVPWPVLEFHFGFPYSLFFFT